MSSVRCSNSEKKKLTKKNEKKSAMIAGVRFQSKRKREERLRKNVADKKVKKKNEKSKTRVCRRRMNGKSWSRRGRQRNRGRREKRSGMRDGG